MNDMCFLDYFVNLLGKEYVFPSFELNCQVMVGAGYPLASQSRVMLAPRGP